MPKNDITRCDPCEWGGAALRAFVEMTRFKAEPAPTTVLPEGGGGGDPHGCEGEASCLSEAVTLQSHSLSSGVQLAEMAAGAV